MKRNLIFISQFCETNKTSVEFLPSSFCVNHLQTGAILLHGRTKDDVFECPTNSSTLSSCFPVLKPLLLTSIIAWDILPSLFFDTWFHITSSILRLPYLPHFIVKTVIAIKVINYLLLNPHLFPPLLFKLSSMMYGPLPFC